MGSEFLQKAADCQVRSDVNQPCPIQHFHRDGGVAKSIEEWTRGTQRANPDFKTFSRQVLSQKHKLFAGSAVIEIGDEMQNFEHVRVDSLF